MKADNWCQIKDIDKIDSPSLIIYLDRVKQNISIAKSMIDNVERLRPHVKTHKTIEIIKLLLNEGVEKFKCATISECEMVAMAGGKDILLAYQPLGPKLSRFFELLEKYPGATFSCLFDNQETIDGMATMAEKNNLRINVYLDLNMGMNRTGISPGNEAFKLYQYASELQGIEVLGLHAYDGHIRNVDFEERSKATEEAFIKVLQLKEEIIRNGLEEPTIIAGGTPTYPIHAKRKDVECSPGTFVFWDKGYEAILPEQPFLHAALVLCRIISLPSKNKICLDLGHKSVASENDLGKRVYFLNAPELKFAGHSEEHLIAEVPENHNYEIGDVFYGVLYHICPTCALYDTAIIVDNHEVVGEWKIIARNRKISC
jgi:D-threonine aldolase